MLKSKAKRSFKSGLKVLQNQQSLSFRLSTLIYFYAIMHTWQPNLPSPCMTRLSSLLTRVWNSWQSWQSPNSRKRTPVLLPTRSRNLRRTNSSLFLLLGRFAARLLKGNFEMNNKPNKFFKLKKQHKTLITMDKISDARKGKNSNQFLNMMVDAQIESTLKPSKD